MQIELKVVLNRALFALFSFFLVRGVGGTNYSFPENFMFGVATAAYQIEGGWDAGGKGESMWDTYLHKHPEFTLDGTNGDVTADSYHQYKQDVAMVQSLGVKYYRMSISWPRILPNGTDDYINEEGVSYYRAVFQELIKVNVTPVVTLYHFDLPTQFMDLGGWTNPVMVDYFEDYARVAFKLFGDLVKIWNTINEPHVHCNHGYGGAYSVPALNFSGVADYLCTHHILIGHAKAYRLYDKEFRPHQKGKIAIVVEGLFVEPNDINNAADAEAAERLLQTRMGLYIHPIFSKKGDYPESVRKRIDELSKSQNYPRSRLPVFTKEEVDLLRGSSDFLGLNYYTSRLASASEMEKGWIVPSVNHDTGAKMTFNPAWPLYGTGWLRAYPQGLRKITNWITKNYGQIPIIITENGMSDFGGINDYERINYCNQHLEQLLLAMHEDKCNIIGYFAWTLIDDFEWIDGHVVKFGLFHVDFDSPQKTRTPKLSAINFREIIRTKKVNFNFIKVPN